MHVLRRPETSQGRLGFWESGDSAQTRTVEPEIVKAVRGIRGQRYYTAVFELIDLFAETNNDSKELPVDPRAFARARDLLERLPNGFAVPEIGIDPDGEIALDWIRSNRTLVSVSVGAFGNLSYAAHLRDGTAHGEIKLRDGFPPALTDVLRRLFHPA